MGTRNTNSLGWLASWLERHWKWFVTAAALLVLFAVSVPMFATDLLLVQIQAETNTSFINYEWVRPIQTSVSYLGTPVAALICHWLSPTYVILVGAATSSTLLLIASLVHNEIVFLIVVCFFSPLSVTLCLHSVVYVLSTHFPKSKLTKSLAISTIGIPMGDFVGRKMGEKLMGSGNWRTPLQVSAGVLLALLAPFSIFMSPKERRLRQPGSTFQQRKAKRTPSTNMVTEGSRVENEQRLQRASSSDISLDASKTSIRTDCSTVKMKTPLFRDCNLVVSFAIVLLPPMTWFIHWFGMETIWQEIDHSTEVANLLSKITIASEVAGKLSIAVASDKIDMASNMISCFVIQFLLYVIVCFTELTLPSISGTVPITTVVSGCVKGMFTVLAFSIVIRTMGSSHYRRQPVTVTMVAVGSGYICGLLLTVGVYLTTNALRHVFFLNILAYQFALLMIVALPIQTTGRKGGQSLGHRGLSSRDSVSTDAVQLSVVVEEHPTNSPSNSDAVNAQTSGVKVFKLRRKTSTTW